MKKLNLRVQYIENGEKKEKEVSIPYEKGKSVRLPDEYPFNQNFYLGPDDGFSLRDIEFLPNGKSIEYCRSVVELIDGKACFSPFKDKRYIFYLEIK